MKHYYDRYDVLKQWFEHYSQKLNEAKEILLLIGLNDIYMVKIKLPKIFRNNISQKEETWLDAKIKQKLGPMFFLDIDYKNNAYLCVDALWEIRPTDDE